MTNCSRFPAANAAADHPDADAEAVRAFHRCFATGVTVVTTLADGEPRGLVVNAFSSLSLDPPLVLVCIAESAQSYPAFFGATTFGVNLLAANQADVAKRFAISGADKFAGLAWEHGPFGAPRIEGGLAFLEARMETRVHASTHTVFIGRVLDATSLDGEPLIYWDGQLWHPDRLRSLP